MALDVLRNPDEFYQTVLVSKRKMGSGAGASVAKMKKKPDSDR